MKTEKEFIYLDKETKVEYLLSVTKEEERALLGVLRSKDKTEFMEVSGALKSRKLNPKSKKNEQEKIYGISDTPSKIKITEISTNPFQPRLDMDDEKLNELIESIKEKGLVQPIPVARYNKGEKGEEIIAIAGHRRLEAHKRLGIEYIKVNITDDVSKQDLASMALIENTHRDDLTIIEISIQCKSLLDNGIFSSSRELAKATGTNESTVSRVLSLLHLPQDVINDIRLNKSTKDIIVLNALSRLKNENLAKDLYYWFIDNNISREDMLLRIKEFKLGNKKPITHDIYNIKNTAKGCVIKLPQLSDEKLKKVEAFIKKLA